MSTEKWEITNMLGPMAALVPGVGVRAGEKFELHLQHSDTKHVAELLVHTAALMELDFELEKLEPSVRLAAKLAIYPRAVRAYVDGSLGRGWDPAQQRMIEMDAPSMRGVLLTFKQNGVF